VKKTVRLFLGAAALALCLSASVVWAQQDTSTSTSTSITSDTTMSSGTMVHHTDWSRRYELTPIEHKRLRAFGLTDEEVFAAANAAEKTGIQLDAPNFDDPAQMILRGRAMWQIAQDLNIPVTALASKKPEWETAEWRQAVDEGSWYAHPAGVSTSVGATTTTRYRTRTERRSTGTETTQPSTNPPSNQPNTGQ
jgi:hypothetical protein